MLVHLLSAGEPPSPRNDQRGVEAKKSVGQESVGPQRPLPRDPGLRGLYADRLVPVRRPGGAPSDRCTTYLPQSRPASRGQEVVEDHVLLRRSEVSRARCCEVRPACCARFDREQRRRSRGSVPCGFTEDGSRAGVALVRDAADVPQGRLPHRRPSRDERCSHAENDCTTTRKETLIADLQYSASRAGRSAGRSLSWHGRGRGFKSHPVHSVLEQKPRAMSCAPQTAQTLVWRDRGRDPDVSYPADRGNIGPLTFEVPALAHFVGFANPAAKLVIEFIGARNSEMVHKQSLCVWIGSPDPWIDYSALEVEVSIKRPVRWLGASEPAAGSLERYRRLRHRQYGGAARFDELDEALVEFNHERWLPPQMVFDGPAFSAHHHPSYHRSHGASL